MKAVRIKSTSRASRIGATTQQARNHSIDAAFARDAGILRRDQALHHELSLPAPAYHDARRAWQARRARRWRGQ
jgi:hypothetical protein